MEFEELRAQVSGADEAVVLRAELFPPDDLDAAEVPFSHALFAVAAFDGLIIGVLWIDGDDGGANSRRTTSRRTTSPTTGLIAAKR